MSSPPKLAIDVDQAALRDLCRRHHIRKLSAFGSVVRSDFRADSDIDLLVEFEAGHTPGWEIVDIGEEFETVFGGRRVELVNPKYVNRHLKDRVFDDAVVLYESPHAA